MSLSKTTFFRFRPSSSSEATESTDAASARETVSCLSSDRKLDVSSSIFISCTDLWWCSVSSEERTPEAPAGSRMPETGSRGPEVDGSLCSARVRRPETGTDESLLDDVTRKPDVDVTGGSLLPDGGRKLETGNGGDSILTEDILLPEAGRTGGSTVADDNRQPETGRMTRSLLADEKASVMSLPVRSGSRDCVAQEEEEEEEEEVKKDSSSSGSSTNFNPVGRSLTLIQTGSSGAFLGSSALVRRLSRKLRRTFKLRSHSGSASLSSAARRRSDADRLDGTEAD